MVRPRAKELTPRELAVMHIFWDCDSATAEEARDRMEERGEVLAYVTVANVVRGLADRGVLKQITKERPFRYCAAKSFDEVSNNLIGDLVSRLFSGSRQALLVQLFSQRKLNDDEREFLAELLERQQAEESGDDQ